MATLLPEGKQSFTNTAGAPLVGGKVYTYDAGTSNPRTTYQDAAGTTPNANPIILDARGEATIFWSGAYKVILKDASDVTIWTVDNVVSADTYSSTLDTALRADLATKNNAAKGAGQIGFDFTTNYAVGTLGWDNKNRGLLVQVSAANTAAQNDAAFAAAWALSKYLDIPSGTYSVSALPNFASNGARIRGLGRVVLNFSGIGNGLVVDAGATPGVVNYDIVIENITISGTAFGTNGVYIRGITHSTFRRLRPINFPLAALRCEFMVSNQFDDFCYSGNEAGITVTTAQGVILEKRGVGEQCSDCTWINPIIEGTSGDGIRANEAAMNTFVGGTSEGNGYNGGAGAVYLGANSFGNTFVGLDMEHNGKAGDATSYHVKDYGLRNKFINPICDSALSDLFWAAGGNSGSIEGGQIGSLKIDAAVKNFQTSGVAYIGTITDNGVSSRHIQRFSIPGAVVDMPDSYIQTKTWTPVPTGLTVVGTPTYVGTYQQIGRLVIFSIRATSTTSTANTGGASFDLPIAAAVLGVCGAVSNNTGLGLGQGTGAIAVTRCYPPTWAADSDVQISGQYWTA